MMKEVRVGAGRCARDVTTGSAVITSSFQSTSALRAYVRSLRLTLSSWLRLLLLENIEKI